jgi:hypothetical protein
MRADEYMKEIIDLTEEFTSKTGIVVKKIEFESIRMGEASGKPFDELSYTKIKVEYES